MDFFFKKLVVLFILTRISHVLQTVVRAHLLDFLSRKINMRSVTETLYFERRR